MVEAAECLSQRQPGVSLEVVGAVLTELRLPQDRRSGKDVWYGPSASDLGSEGRLSWKTLRLFSFSSWQKRAGKAKASSPAWKVRRAD